MDVSVIIPTHNRRVFLEKAINSCFQGNEEIDIEVIVVDDGSTDGTREYLKSINDGRIRTIFQPNRGVQVARNKGMKYVQGRYTKHLDDDDYLAPGGLQKQVSFLDATGLPCCYGDCYVDFQTPELDHIERRVMPSYKDLVVGTVSGLTRWNLLFLFDTTIAKKARWDPGLETLHIIAYLLEFARHESKCQKVDAPVAVHRIHRNERISSTHLWETSEVRKIEFNLYHQFLAEVDVTTEQREALLAKMWEQAHMLSAFDWQSFRSCYQQIQQHVPEYRPERSHPFLQATDELFSPIVTEMMLYPLRRLKH